MMGRIKSAVLDCYQYREVLYNILSQDLKVKYKRTFFGYVWSLLNPILQLVVLAFVFSHITRLAISDYTLFLFSGMIAWSFFQNSLISASTSLLDNENFIKKIYLPKLLFPLSRVCLKAVDFIFSMVALTLIAFVFGFDLNYSSLLLPAAIAPLFIFTLGLGLMVSVATVYFRDIVYLLGVFLQLLYFGTPILYQAQMIPSSYRFLFDLNPVFRQIHLFQMLIYEGRIPSQLDWLIAWGLALATLIGGVGLLLLLEEDVVFRM